MASQSQRVSSLLLPLQLLRPSSSSARTLQESLLAFLLCGCLLLHLTSAQLCPGGVTPSPVLDEKVKRSEVVLQGRVRQQFKVSGSRGFTATIEVLCVYKGGPVPSRVNVTGAGTSDSCVTTQLAAGSVNLMYLRRVGADLTPTFSEDPAQRKYLDELQFACGLQVMLPTDVPSNDNCKPQDFDYDGEDCGEEVDLPPAGAATTTCAAPTSLLLLSVAGAVWLGRGLS